MVEAVNTFEKPVNLYKTTERNKPKEVVFIPTLNPEVSPFNDVFGNVLLFTMRF
jgi:hypothetical protein